MQKTGESYTSARLQLLKKRVEPASDPGYAKVAGMSDASVSKRTGRTWAEWVRLLDAAKASGKPHREIVGLISAQGVADWWSQMVTVGYERIRGLRERGQRRGGSYEASKSRTFPIPVGELFDAFANARKRTRWLSKKAAVRSATPGKRMRMTWEDGSTVVFEFIPKGSAKSAVAVGHLKLPDKKAAEESKKAWGERFDRLGEFLS